MKHSGTNHYNEIFRNQSLQWNTPEPIISMNKSKGDNLSNGPWEFQRNSNNYKKTSNSPKKKVFLFFFFSWELKNIKRQSMPKSGRTPINKRWTYTALKFLITNIIRSSGGSYAKMRIRWQHIFGNKYNCWMKYEMSKD